jgi:hypothetical protein
MGKHAGIYNEPKDILKAKIDHLVRGGKRRKDEGLSEFRAMYEFDYRNFMVMK